MYRLIHHGYAELPSKEAWLPEKNTTVTIPWRPSKLKPMPVHQPPASSCRHRLYEHHASGILFRTTPGLLGVFFLSMQQYLWIIQPHQNLPSPRNSSPMSAGAIFVISRSSPT